MSGPRPARVIVALEPGGSADEAAEAGARLAARLGVGLTGLAVEDEALLALGGHAWHLPLPGGVGAALEPAGLEAELRAWTRRAERVFSAAAARRGLAWEFLVRRGALREVLAAEERAQDLLVVPREGRAIFSAARLAGGGVAAAWEGTGLALLAAPEDRRGATAVALSCGAVDDALAAALAVAEPGTALEVLLCGEGAQEGAARAWLERQRRAARFTHAARLAEVLAARGAGWETVVLGRRSLDEADRRAVARVACGVLLVG